MSKELLWPDLSKYGVTLGIVHTEQNKTSLVFSDENGLYANVARNMGFRKTRWPGLWVRPDTTFEPNAFRRLFPELEIVTRTPEQIGEEIIDRIRGHVDRARQRELPGIELASIGVVGGRSVDISPLAESVPLGMNYHGEDVFQGEDGRRYIMVEVDGRQKMGREPEDGDMSDEVAARFLRAPTDNARDLCADGFVRSMAEGRIARVDDFARFFLAITGRSMETDDPEITEVAGLVDRARVRRLAGLARNPDADAFGAALRLHEAAQYYTLITANRMTPLPVGVVLQHIAAAMPQGSTIRIDSEASGEFSIFGGGAFRSAADGELQDILLAAYEPRKLDAAVEKLGTAVNRHDHASVLRALELMSPAGLGLFVVGGDGKAGGIGAESRRFMDALANMYAIEGIVDVDGALTGTPGAPPSRIIVVGARRETPGHGGLPAQVPYVTDYEQLWVWGDKITQAIRKPGAVSYVERGGVSREGGVAEKNAYQAPYIPTSMVSDPVMMVPRNLASPLRRAMLNVMKAHPDIDEWIEERLGMEPGALKREKRMDAEQVDAVALALHRMDRGLGFIQADHTGVGKGRTLAAMAAASAIRGEPVVFLTEKAELFNAFWRDIEDIGAERLFRNIFVLNDGATVTSMRTGAVVAQSADRERVEAAMRQLKYPDGVDIVFATYSQFNRDPIKAIRNHSGINIDAKRADALSERARRLMNWARQARALAGKKEAQEVVVEAFDLLTDPSILPQLPMEALKSLWIGKCVDNALLIMDESHNAAGEDSQTNMNLSHAVMRARNVVYSSATFGRSEKTMRIYRRAFPASVDVEGMHETLRKGGEALQEAMSSMLAEDGALVRREHDLSMIRFTPAVDTGRLALHEQHADQLAEILSAMTVLTAESRQYSDALSLQMRQQIEAMHKARGTALPPDKLKEIGVVNTSPIGNSLYTTMRAFLTLKKVDLAIEKAVGALREGRKPVLVIDHTMQAELNRAVERARQNGTAREVEGGVVIPQSNFRQLLRDMLEGMTRVTLDGNALELKQDAKLAAVIRQIEQLIEKFPAIPVSPIDMVRQGIEAAGFTCAELSGRTRRAHYLDDGRMVVSHINKADRNEAKDRFNNGDAHAIIITRAGNAGIDLHSSVKFINTAQRELIEVEVPEDVVTRTQFFGRVHRKGERCPPVITTLSCGLPAENRVLALQNNKLRKLSANITANRDNAALTKDIADILNVVGNEVAFRFLESNPELAKKLDIGLPDMSEKDDNSFELRGEKYVSQLMLRLCLLPSRQQQQIIEEVTAEFEARVEELDAAEENPLKPRFYNVNASKVGSEVLEHAGAQNRGTEAPSAFDRPVTITQIEYMRRLMPIPAPEVMSLVQAGERDFLKSVENTFGTETAQVAASGHDDFIDGLIQRIMELRNAKMEAALSKKHATVAEAMADPEVNMVKTIKARTQRLMDVLGSLRVGCVLRVKDAPTGLTINGAVVTGLSLPANPEHLANPARYRLRYVVPGDRDVRSCHLSTLLKAATFDIVSPAPTRPVLAEYDRCTEYARTERRSILDGNLFRAAEMSMQAGTGKQAYYSDEHGMAHRAVVLPLEVTKKDFNHLPLRIHDARLAAEFFSSVNMGTLYSLSGAGKADDDTFRKIQVMRGICVRRDNTEIIISLPGTRSWALWLRNHPELLAVTGPFGGTRDVLYATVPVSLVDKLVHEIYKTGTTLYAHSDAQVERKNAKGQVVEEGRVSARRWFLDRLGISASVTDTKNAVPRDPMADVDTKKRRRGNGR